MNAFCRAQRVHISRIHCVKLDVGAEQDLEYEVQEIGPSQPPRLDRSHCGRQLVKTISPELSSKICVTRATSFLQFKPEHSPDLSSQGHLMDPIRALPSIIA